MQEPVVPWMEVLAETMCRKAQKERRGKSVAAVFVRHWAGGHGLQGLAKARLA